MSSLHRIAQGLRVQWVASRTLRLGVWTLALLVWVQALLMAGDAAKASEQRAMALQDEWERTQVLARDKTWPQRAEDARQQLAALRAQLWPESNRGLAEAAAQDWVRATAAKAGLPLRDLALVRGVATAVTTPAASAAAGASPQAIRLRVNAELSRLPLMAFLAEVQRSERAVVVDLMVLRPASQPPSADLELRLMAMPAGAAGGVR
jgi:hypothetical protein